MAMLLLHYGYVDFFSIMSDEASLCHFFSPL
jgi:hypothetical protein